MNTKSITPLPPADFTPEMGDYRTLQPFRYWCQKVLPLVYDDSLSYYELLCKVVDYLNKTIEDVGILEGDVIALHEAYVKLQSWVNDYFSTLDVQEEINNKLDEMFKNGQLDSILLRLNKNKLLSARIFSYTDRYGSQFILYTCNTFLIFNDSNKKVKMTELSTTGKYIADYDLEADIHPNGGWFKDDKIYICASGTTSIYVFDYLTKQLLETINVGGENALISGCYYNKKQYYTTLASDGSGQSLFILNDDGTSTLIGTCKYHRNEYPYSMVVQSFGIYENVIYLLFNRPNIILKYNLTDCTYIGEYLLEEGDGTYPFGELENMISIKNKVYLLTDLYYAGSLRKTFTTELFLTNIGENVIPSTSEGQDTWTHETMYVDSNSEATNPNGTSANPFKSLAEACIVYQYLFKNRHNVTSINIINGNYDEGILLNNCNFEINANLASITGYAIYNCNGFIRALTCDDTTVCEIRGSNVRIMNVNGANKSYITASTLFASRVKNNFYLANSNISGTDYYIAECVNSFTLNNTYQQSGISFTKESAGTFDMPVSISNMFENITCCKITFNVFTLNDSFNGLQNNGNVVGVVLNSSDINSIRNNETITREVCLTTYRNNIILFNVIKVEITLTSITLKTLLVNDIANTSTEVNPTYYANVFNFEY